MIWEWDIASNSVECVVACRGHDKSVECVAIAPDASIFATGSWDNNIKIWSASTNNYLFLNFFNAIYPTTRHILYLRIRGIAADGSHSVSHVDKVF